MAIKESIEFASTNSSFFTILGITAFIAGLKNTDIIVEIITNTYILSMERPLLSLYITAYTPMSNPLNKSEQTIICFLSNQSAITPAIGDKTNLGIIAIPNTDANLVADPVIFSTYNDKAKLWILLPNKETSFPIIKNKKSFLRKRLNVAFILYSHP